MLKDVIFIGSGIAMGGVLALLMQSLRCAEKTADERLKQELFIHNKKVLRIKSGVSEDESYQKPNFLKMRNTGNIPNETIDIPFKSFYRMINGTNERQ
ncbi:hypothetical protein AALB53_22490 [Lachnospiraceae bacterium 47-T17]